MTRYNTLLLDQTEWDLVLDSAGNIALAKPAYALAQDVASAVRLFKGELWYNTPAGIPYFSNILGKLPPLSLTTGLLEKAAFTVPGVVKVQAKITGFRGRNLTGQIKFIDEVGNQNAASF